MKGIGAAPELLRIRKVIRKSGGEDACLAICYAESQLVDNA